jgi:pyruvate dehydrogenase E1 component alpha subunit
MARETIALPYRVEHLSILDEDGSLDEDLEPHISEELLLRIYQIMVLTRRLDSRMIDLQRQGRIGTFPPITGHEASHIGAISTIDESDWLVPSYRETGAELWRGRKMENILLYWAGFDEGAGVEPWRNDLPVSVPIGTQTLHAVGLAYGVKYRKENRVVMSFFGDGATSQGDFHEAMNFAGVFQLPAVFVCQNNQWAISLPRSRQTRSETIAQKAIAYGMPGIQVDGNDVLAVHSAAKEAVDRARAGGGPSLIESLTYRMTMHTTSDDPRRYRTEEEEKLWLKRDPIVRFQQYLLQKEILTPKKMDAIEAEVKAEIQAAVDAAEARMKQGADPLHMFEHVYAEMPPILREHREELRRELELERRESGEAEPEEAAAVASGEEQGAPAEMVGRAGHGGERPGNRQGDGRRAA